MRRILSIPKLVTVAWANFFFSERFGVQALIVAIVYGLAVAAGRPMFSNDLTGRAYRASVSLINGYKNLGLGSGYYSNDTLTEEEKTLVNKLKDSQVGGLWNEGNTCFANSVLQSLASCDSILDYTADTGSTVPNFSAFLRKLIYSLNHVSGKRHSYSTEILRNYIGGEDRWHQLQQEDAQEFFLQLLEALEKDWKDAHPADPEADKDEEKSEENTETNEEKLAQRILTPFDGAYAERVSCATCGGMDGIKTDVLSSVDLMLDSPGGKFTLEGLLAKNCEMETISDVECYRCTLLNYRAELEKKLGSGAPAALLSLLRQRKQEVDEVLLEKVIAEDRYAALKATSFKTLRDKHKQRMFTQPLPRVLMFHINRSVYINGFVRKNTAPVTFPARLDMSQFVTDPNDKYNTDTSHPMKGTSDIPQWYALKATVIHRGQSGYGHYLSFRKHQGAWWAISDDYVQISSEATVLGEDDIFMVFYEKEQQAAEIALTDNDAGVKAVTEIQQAPADEIAADELVLVDASSASESPEASPILGPVKAMGEVQFSDGSVVGAPNMLASVSERD